jgi:hypothetical protein
MDLSGLLLRTARRLLRIRFKLFMTCDGGGYRVFRRVHVPEDLCTWLLRSTVSSAGGALSASGVGTPPT